MSNTTGLPYVRMRPFKLLLIVAILYSTITFSQKDTENILFFGNSLTAGFGLDPVQAFPNLIQEKIHKLGKNYSIVNAGLSGETSAGGFDRIEWVMSQPFGIFVLELGANDGLRGLPLESTRSNLQGIIDKVREKYPDVKIVVAGMMVPPNMGEEYSNEFVKIYPELARENNASLIPFLLDGVAGNPDLNLPDGIHPNVEGHRIVADNVWKVLKPLL
ncbi:MAG: arylesterase [Cytophagales bacterium]|nr:arylesterase [Cytophagales bacterium]